MPYIHALLDLVGTYDPIGNLLSKGGVSYTYPASGPGSVRPHAVTSLSTGWTYQYDANGNVTQRVEGGTTYVQEFDAENRLEQVTVGGQVTEFSYDGDGNRVKKVAGGQTTIYVGNYYEKQGTTVTTYYYINGQRVAMRVDDGSQEVVYYLHADHLGSTSLTTNASGGVVAEQRYYPYGEERWASGTLPTDRRFTGQRWEQGLGLYDYNARWYHPVLGRFVSADTIVPEPGNPQGLNRFAYVQGNPLKYTDPSGHIECLDGACNWVEHPVSEKIRWHGPIPPVVAYIREEMMTNAQGEIAKSLQSLNGTCYTCGWAEMPGRLPGVGEGLKSAAIADTVAKAEAFAAFGCMVRQKGPWDPKPDIGKAYGFSQMIEDEWYYYDVWGNVMFGYLGTAAGFSESELLEGAGAEQIGSSLGYAIRNWNSSYLPRRESGVSGLRAWDDPVDQVTTQIGINLWNAYDLSIAPTDIIWAIGTESRIPTRDEPW